MTRYSFFLILFLACSIFAAQSQEWLTHYEFSGYKETPRYEATMQFSQRLAEASPFIHYTSLGKSPQGRDIAALIIDKNGNFTPEAAKQSGNAIILVEASIHAGESEGKDAGLMFIRDLIIHNKFPHLLSHTTLVFIPIFNVDGHERFSPYSRINQNGPVEMGWRTTAQNLNLNRDFAKADAPEMQHWLQFFNHWLPDFFMDIHTTDGADYQYTLTYAMHTLGDMNEAQTQWQKEYIKKFRNDLDNKGILTFPYVSFKKWHDPKSGLIEYIASPRFSTGYGSNQNRPSLLVETHMLKDYKTRVTAVYELLKTSIEYIDENYQSLKNINEQADNQASQLTLKTIPLNYEISMTDSTSVVFKGIGYTIEKSELTGGLWHKYNGQNQNFDLQLFNKQLPKDMVKLPAAYIIPAEQKTVIQRLKYHGIEYQTLKQPQSYDIETYKFSHVKLAGFTYESHQIVENFEMEPITFKKTFPQGSIIIPVNQRSAKLIAQLLEPQGSDSFFKWGFMNGIFEQKEYVESYVMEKKAREMIAKDPKLLNQYNQAIKENPEAYKNSYNKLQWFYKQTPYYDQELNVYPIGRIMTLN